MLIRYYAFFTLRHAAPRYFMMMPPDITLFSPRYAADADAITMLLRDSCCFYAALLTIYADTLRRHALR